MPNIGSQLGNAAKMTGEAVAKPLSNEASKMTQTTIESLTSQTTNPAPTSQNPKQGISQQSPQNPARAASDETRKQNILKFFDTLSKNEQSLTAQRQKEAQAKQQAEAAEQEKKEIKQFEVAKKKEENINREVYKKQRQVEIKQGGR